MLSSYLETLVVVGVDTLELDALDDVLLDTLVLRLVEEVVVVGVDTLELDEVEVELLTCLLYTSPSPRDLSTSRMPSSA